MPAGGVVLVYQDVRFRLQGAARVGSMTARFRCLGGVDSDARAIRDFDRLAGVPGTVLDLFDREQYTAFHGSPPPPAGWREATPQDQIGRASCRERVSSPV